MKKRFLLIALALFLGMATLGQAADPTVTSGTLVMTSDGDLRATTIQQKTLTWTSDSGGNVVATTDRIEGTINRIVYNPGATAPTALYDVVLTDDDSVDMLNGTGANLSATVTTSTIPTEGDGTTNIPMVTQGTLTLTITNAGNAKGGVIRLYMKP